jgi:hypothetical protein
MRKYEIARLLAQRYGYSSYLEICTAITGGTFSHVDKGQFQRRARLMYRCPPDFSDGEPIDFATEAESGEALFGEIVRSGERFDLVFIDPWHTYASSLRDVVFGLQLVKDDGLVLLHDCSPPHPACAEPEFRPGEWCGITFAVYLDLVLFNGGLHYLTVDADYGCGIISQTWRPALFSDLSHNAALAAQWRALDLAQKYSFLAKHRASLLHLISTDEFRRRLFEEASAAAEQVKTG